MKSYYNVVELLVAIICVDNGTVKVLLRKKQTEPYKGYWIMPSDFLMNNETLEESVKNIIERVTGLKNVFFSQCDVLSDLNRDNDNRILAFPFLAITTKENVSFKINDSNYCWFSFNDLPKLGYDHNKILKNIYNDIFKNVVNKNFDFVCRLFPSDFTLPELQVFFENILNTKIDRRNFRKKVILKGIIKDTGYKNNEGTGRPGVLYRFETERRESKDVK